LTKSLKLVPIAYIKSRFQVNTPAEDMRKHPSQLVVEPEFRSGLMGLKSGDDILVLFYFHRIRAEEIELQLHPRHDPQNPLSGVFATRSQFRPNQIGATVVRIEHIEAGEISVSGLDAQDGAPVLDIKPYAPYFDADTVAQQFEVRQVTSLQEARTAIDGIDAEVMRLLGNRAKYVHQVVNFKKRPEEVPAPDRYKQVMQQRRAWAETAGLNPDVIESMYKLLLDNFIDEELEIMRQREEGLSR
jgi:tRNA-Thr(GGU) m(6)t(6)A37 methyltransferase TsaA